MISFETLMSGFLSEEPSRLSMPVPEGWTQGRTLYGGLSAALCHASVKAETATQKPLRSALFCFVGPVSGEVKGEVKALRQGRSTLVTEATLHAEKGLGTRATLVYGDARESRLNVSDLTMPDVSAPEDCQPMFPKSGGPSFTQNFSVLKAGGEWMLSGAQKGEMLVWCRHDSATGNDHEAALLALADVIPPASFAMFTEPAPISTITWSIEFLAPSIEVSQNWFLFQSKAEHTQDGYSSQAMYMWDRQGRPVLAARQNVTIFY